MTTKLHRALVLLAIGATTAATARAQATPARYDDVANQFGKCQLRLRNLTHAVRARLDQADEAEDQAAETRRRRTDLAKAVAKAEAVASEAKLAVDLAETALKEYEAGTLARELEKAGWDIALADAKLKSTEGRLEAARGQFEEAKALVARMEQAPKASAADLMAEYLAGMQRNNAGFQVRAAEFEIERAKVDREQASVAKEVLVKYTKPRRLLEFRAEVEKARSVAYARRAEVEIARDGEARFPFTVVDDRPLTRAETEALAKVAALGKGWKAILARRDEIERGDPARRDESKRLVGDFEQALAEAERAWTSAREARLDDRCAATLHRAGRAPAPGGK